MEQKHNKRNVIQEETLLSFNGTVFRIICKEEPIKGRKKGILIEQLIYSSSVKELCKEYPHFQSYITGLYKEANIEYIPIMREYPLRDFLRYLFEEYPKKRKQIMKECVRRISNDISNS